MIKDDVFLLAGNFVSVLVDLPAPWKNDVMDSLLFSQLYADSEANRFDGAEQWYSNYNRALMQVKWDRQVYKGNVSKPKDDAVIVLKHLIKEKIGCPEIERLENFICCIVQSIDSEEHGAALRGHAVVTSQAGRFSEASTISLQVSVVGVGPVVYSALICFKTTEDVDVDFMSQGFLGKFIVGQISINVSQQLLNKVSYERNRIREKLSGQLSDKKEGLIVDLSSKKR